MLSLLWVWKIRDYLLKTAGSAFGKSSSSSPGSNWFRGDCEFSFDTWCELKWTVSCSVRKHLHNYQNTHIFMCIFLQNSSTDIIKMFIIYLLQLSSVTNEFHFLIPWLIERCTRKKSLSNTNYLDNLPELAQLFSIKV